MGWHIARSMRLVKQADTVTGGVLFLFSLAVLFESRKLPLIYLTAVGPGFLPVGVSLVLVALSALLCISGVRGNRAEDHTIEWPSGRGLTAVAQRVEPPAHGSAKWRVRAAPVAGGSAATARSWLNFGGDRCTRMVGVLIGLVGYTLLMPFLGYVLSTAAFMFVLIRLLGSYRWYWTAGLSLVMALCTYIVFRLWLNLALPTGLLVIP
jgi:hypothetical protein